MNVLVRARKNKEVRGRVKGEASIPLICDNCGVGFSRRLAEVRRDTKDPRYSGAKYCSKKCYGRVLGKLYGFKVHPENIGHRFGCKYEYLTPQLLELAQQGYSCYKAACMLGLPSPSGTAYASSFKKMLAEHNITFSRRERRTNKEMRIFTEEEAAKLTLLSVKRELDRFFGLLDSNMDFDKAMKEIFGEERDEHTNSTSM